MKTLKCFGQEISNINKVNQGHFQKLKREIKFENFKLKPLLIIEVEKGVWPMLKYSKRFRSLVALKQKHLALLSSEYSLHSTQVEN